MVVPRRLEVGEDSQKIVDSFRYLGDVTTYGGGVEMTVRDRVSCAWSKWRKLASLLVNHSIPLVRGKNKGLLCVCEACIAVCCRNLGSNRKTGRTAS